MSGEIIGQAYSYQLLEELGSGLSSCVFKALRYDKGKYFEDLVALKILNSQTLDRLMKQEMVSLRAVSSPNLANMVAWDFCDGRPILVFEYVESVSLKQLVGRHELSLEEISELLRQIQQGLMDLSQAGVCHGDLSPENILIDCRGRVRLIDYGLGNVLGRLGTQPYVAPEVEQGVWANPTSDLFSLSVIGWELLKDRAGSTQVESCLWIWQSPAPSNRTWQKIEMDPCSPLSLAKKVQSLIHGGARTTQPLPSVYLGDFR